MILKILPYFEQNKKVSQAAKVTQSPGWRWRSCQGRGEQTAASARGQRRVFPIIH